MWTPAQTTRTKLRCQVMIIRYPARYILLTRQLCRGRWIHTAHIRYLCATNHVRTTGERQREMERNGERERARKASRITRKPTTCTRSSGTQHQHGTSEWDGGWRRARAGTKQQQYGGCPVPAKEQEHVHSHIHKLTQFHTFNASFTRTLSTHARSHTYGSRSHTASVRGGGGGGGGGA
jgi:hypothetical protein